MIFSELGQVSVAWRKTSSQPTGSVNSTPTNTARTELPAQHDHMSPREHDWLKSCKAQDCTSLCLQNHCPPRVMSRPVPHRTLTTSTSSLSPVSSTSPTFPTVSPLHTGPKFSSLIFPAMFHGRVADQHKSPFLTGYETFKKNCQKRIDAMGRVRRTMTQCSSEYDGLNDSVRISRAAHEDGGQRALRGML